MDCDAAVCGRFFNDGLRWLYITPARNDIWAAMLLAQLLCARWTSQIPCRTSLFSRSCSAKKNGGAPPLFLQSPEVDQAARYPPQTLFRGGGAPSWWRCPDPGPALYFLLPRCAPGFASAGRFSGPCYYLDGRREARRTARGCLQW
ncbi:unnamed protein product, partial [Amoebophrya sp. A120]|eukprot:GSA120T00024867001.1